MSGGPKSADARVRTNLRPLLLSGKSVKGDPLSKDWLAGKWVALLDAHYGLPTPGRAVAVEDARYMIEHSLATISVGKGTVQYEPRTMACREVAAVQGWLLQKETELAAASSELTSLERSLAAQASHYHEENGGRLLDLATDLKDDFRGAMEAVLQPKYPEGASSSSEDKLCWIKNRREELNQAARNLRLEANLVRHAKNATGTPAEQTPAMIAAREKAREAIAEIEAELKTQKFKRGVEIGDATRAAKLAKKENVGTKKPVDKKEPAVTKEPVDKKEPAGTKEPAEPKEPAVTKAARHTTQANVDQLFHHPPLRRQVADEVGGAAARCECQGVGESCCQDRLRLGKADEAGADVPGRSA
jgi:hypothetical protein